jgi:hypothetical protein
VSKKPKQALNRDAAMSVVATVDEVLAQAGDVSLSLSTETFRSNAICQVMIDVMTNDRGDEN